MKKSKKIFSALLICFAFVGILLFSSNNKIYASEVSDYIDENYSNLIISNNLCGFNNDSKELSSGSFEINLDSWNINGVDNGTHFWIPLVMPLSKGLYTFNVVFEGESNLTVFELYTYETKQNYETRTSIKYGAFGSFVVTIESEYNITGLFFLFRGSINGSLKFMLNKGSQALPYEPYITGSMIFNQGFQQGLLENATSVLYKAFNGATANLIYDNKVIISEPIYLTENDLYLSINNISDIKTYLKNDETSRYYTLSISLNSAINNELVVSLNNDILDTTLTLFNSLGGYRESFSRAESSLYTIIANSQGKYYDTIVYDSLYAPDYIDFKLNLDLSQLTFEEGYNAGLDAGIYEGYNKGSQEGYNNGYNKGYNEGKTEGYNNGYNEGATSNIETNSIKTLFNSILSYPVNLVSNVLDFEFMGINLASLIMFIVSIGIVVFVVKKFW